MGLTMKWIAFLLCLTSLRWAEADLVRGDVSHNERSSTRSLKKGKKPKQPSNRSYSSSSKSSSKQGKGRGSSSTCDSTVAATIKRGAREAITRNPRHCCNYYGPTAVFATHAMPSDETVSGFEPYWDKVYRELEMLSISGDVCFVMTGYDPQSSSRSLSQILVDVNSFGSRIAQVPAIISTDPTTDTSLVMTLRSIADDPIAPHVGVFNAGWNNVVVEALVSGKERLPFIGYQDDRAYGAEAARVAEILLNGKAASPLCLNPRENLDFIGERCAGFYDAITDDPVQPATGMACNELTVTSILTYIVQSSVNVILAHETCCGVAAMGAQMASGVGFDVIVGCTDYDTIDGRVDFITAQPLELQAYQAGSWVYLPLVMEATSGADGRAEEFFPSLGSLINTEVFSTVAI